MADEDARREGHEHKRLQEEDHEPTTNSVFQRRSSQSWTKARTGSSPTPRLILRGSGSAFQASLTPEGERQSKGRRRDDQLQEDVGARRLGRSDAPRMGSGGPAWTLAQKEDARRTRAGEDCAGLWRRLASMVGRMGRRWGGKEVEEGRRRLGGKGGRTRRSRPEENICTCILFLARLQTPPACSHLAVLLKKRGQNSASSSAGLRQNSLLAANHHPANHTVFLFSSSNFLLALCLPSPTRRQPKQHPRLRPPT